MPSPSSTLPTLLLLFILHLSLSSDSPSAYEILERFGFPKGLLPEGVMSFHLDGNGGFQVVLPCACEFRVEGDGYLLRYEERITGNLKFDRLEEINGVSVKVLMVWLGIKEVVRSGNDLCFYVGPISASFPSSNFEGCPKCGCDSIVDIM